MNDLNPSEAVGRLIRAGWSESRIARHVGTSQPTIHRIKHGQKTVAFEIGLALVRLAAAVSSQEGSAQEVA